MDPDPQPLVDCGIEPWDRVWIGPESAERLRGCNIPVNAILSVPVLEEDRVRKHKPRKARHKEKTVEPTSQQDPAADVAVSRVVDDAAPQEAVPAPVVAHTTVPDHTPELPVGGMADIVGSAGGGPFGILALIVLVVGGGAGWKFWSKLSEQKHEQAMKRLEIESAQFATSGAQPPPCQVKQAEVDAKLSALSSELSELRVRLEKSEKKAAAFGDNFDADEVKDNLSKLERTVREMKAKSARTATTKK